MEVVDTSVLAPDEVAAEVVSWCRRALQGQARVMHAADTERYLPAMPFRVISPDALQWITRPHDEGEPARHVAELSETAGFAHTRANVWRYEPGARGRRHRHPHQEETFVVQSGTLTMYLGEPPERVQVQRGGLIHVDAMTPLQVVNNETKDLVLYVYGYPPEDEHAEILDPAI